MNDNSKYPRGGCQTGVWVCMCRGRGQRHGCGCVFVFGCGWVGVCGCLRGARVLCVRMCAYFCLGVNVCVSVCIDVGVCLCRVVGGRVM